MSLVTKGTERAKTITFPGTVRRVGECAFRRNTLLRSVILNEGLEVLGGEMDANGNNSANIFRRAQIQLIQLPASLRVLGDATFQNCKELRSVTFREGSRLEKIGKFCFLGSGIEEATISKTLKTIGIDAFDRCDSLRFVHVEDGCECSLSGAGIHASVRVVLPRE